jgi:hypothetical protein
MGDVVYDQHLLDMVFNDLEHLLATERPDPVQSCGYCVSCGGVQLSYAGSGTSFPGSLVCDSCGVVQPGCCFWETMYGNDFSHKTSNYKRIHHWHERISQLLLMESQIPHDQMLRIAEKLCDGSYTVINKDAVRAVLRSLNMQLYIEKWLQIIFRVTRIAPPIPGSMLVQKLDAMFQDLQEPFNCFRVAERKNFLNYNYVFCRLFQKLDCTQFCMFFPLIKSKHKLKQLDDMWMNMAGSLQWELKPLAQVAPFAVRLEKPVLLLQRLATEYVPPILVAPQIEPLKMVFRTLDRRSVAKLLREKAPRHSSPPEQRPRKAAAAKKRRRGV